MKPLRLQLVFAFWLMLGNSLAQAAELPKTITSAPCRAAPTIDGLIGDDEWKDVPVIEFDLQMVQAAKPQVVTKWTCQLRVMNSANALYVALRLPDETVNRSLAPFDYDGALLAFCQGKEVAPGDDRKVIGPGVYADKHFTAPGKDADDKQQDGRGGLTHDKGVYTLEWAIPLDSGDKNDIKAKPGDTLRFNLAYFDGLQADFKNTRIGVAYVGTDLNKVAGWGTLKLAADVKDDGGGAFKGPAWVETLFKSFRQVPANRLRMIDSAFVSGSLQPIVKVRVEYTYLDPQGKEQTGKAKLYLPHTVRADAKAKVPLYQAAGYEQNDPAAMTLVQRGYAVVSPSEVAPNPLLRTANPDIALLHIARSLPFVDDTRVVIAGGSAGGYITLLMAAETFPLAGALPDIPPVNWGYNAAYFLQRKKQLEAAGKDPTAPKVPVLDTVRFLGEESVKVIGDNPDEPIWLQNSPLGHIPTITCPVSIYFSTADMLVPIDQVAARYVRPFDPKAFPKDFTMDPEKLMKSREGRLRLLDVLAEKDYELFVLEEKAIQQLVPGGKEAKKPPELPDSKTRQWSIIILDEGPPQPQLGHVKYAVPWSHNDFLKRVTTGQVPASQLTALKLERLMDRYAGKEWLPARLKHLDFPESERADVVRGLKLYVSAGPDNAKTFTQLYGKLPPAKRVLGAEVMRRIQESK